MNSFYCINISFFITTYHNISSSWTKSKQVYTNALQSLLFFSTRSHFIGWSHKLKVHRANCQTISTYPVSFCTDIVYNNGIFFLFYLVSFTFCFSLCVFFCLKQKIYILIHTRLCGRVSDEKIFTRSISGNKATFFCWPKIK